MTTTKQIPLARDIDGDPIEVPAEAVAWRVRRRTGKQGRPQTVFDPETGTPLEIALASDIDELHPYGAGGYRLDSVDANGKMIPGVTAYVEVAADEPKYKPSEPPNERDATIRELRDLLRESIQAHCRTTEALASAFGPVRPAVQPEPVYIAAPAKALGDEKPGNMIAQMKEAWPIIQSVMAMFAPMMQGGGIPGFPAAAAANPVADATPPTDGAAS